MADNINNNTHVNCQLCDADKPKPHLIVEDNTFVECINCGFIYLNPRSQEKPEQGKESIEALTEKGYRTSREPYYENILKGFKQFRQTGNLLEIGCASGGFLNVAKKQGWNVTGVEIDDNIAEVGRKKGQNIITGDICDLNLEAESFDVVVLNMVVEHLPEPKTVMLEINRVLRPNGAVWMHTPNYISTVYKMSPTIENYPDEHFSCFTPNTIRNLCRVSNFIPTYVKTTGFRFPGKRRKWCKHLEKALSMILGRLGKGHRMRILAIKESAAKS